MVSWPLRPQCGPIGIDIGSRSVKLLQLRGDGSAVQEAVRREVPPHDGGDPHARNLAIAEVIRRAGEGRRFRGRRAVLCLGGDDLFVQNIRVPPAQGEALQQMVLAEAAGRVPFGEDAEVRFLEADDVRQGDGFRREVILLACARAAVTRLMHIAEQAGLIPLAVDVVPTAMLRCYRRQFRRDEDRQQRAMFVNVGAAHTTVVIARGSEVLFVKNLDCGGEQLDEAVARNLGLELPKAASLRRHNGDRRSDQRDPEVTRSIAESIRPILERLTQELAMCLRYYSVTFRGQPLERLVLGGGEAGEPFVEWLGGRFDIPCELGNPLRSFSGNLPTGPAGQWDVAAGLALRAVR